jgi:hypothetical protein
MLGLGYEATLTEQDWHALSSRAQLPESLRDYFEKNDAQRVMVDCQRRYTRQILHNRAIMLVGNVRHACYTKDISRMGIGFYAPMNLLPKTILQFWLPYGRIMQLRVTRCRRLDALCYEIGTVFHCESSQKTLIAN